jgi:hypothetical protein
VKFIMTEDFKAGYEGALAFIRHRIGMLRLEYPTNIRKKQMLEKAYHYLLDELVAHLEYNLREEDND